LADQFDLHVLPVAKHHGEIDVGGLSQIFEIFELYVIEREKGARAHRLYPKFERAIEIRRHIRELHDLAQFGNRTTRFHSAASASLAFGKGIPIAFAMVWC